MMSRLNGIILITQGAVFVAAITILVLYTITFNRAKLVLDCTHYVMMEAVMSQGKDLDRDDVAQVRIWCDDFIDNSGRYRETE